MVTYLVTYDTTLDNIPLRVFTDAAEADAYRDEIMMVLTNDEEHPDIEHAHEVYGCDEAEFCCVSLVTFIGGKVMFREVTTLDEGDE